jgi:hypothetical protein
MHTLRDEDVRPLPEQASVRATARPWLPSAAVTSVTGPLGKGPVNRPDAPSA